MKSIITLALLAISITNAFGQNYSEIETELRRGCLFLESPMGIVEDLIKSDKNYVFERDEFIHDEIVKFYFNKKMGSLLLIFYGDRKYSKYEKYCTKVIQSFYYPSSNYEIILEKMRNRSLFKTVDSNTFYYLASTSPMYTALKKQGFKIEVNVEEKVVDAKNKYQIMFTSEMKK